MVAVSWRWRDADPVPTTWRLARSGHWDYMVMTAGRSVDTARRRVDVRKVVQGVWQR